MAKEKAMEKVFEKGIQLLRLANDEYLVIAQYPIRITVMDEEGFWTTDKRMIDESIFTEGLIEPTIGRKEGVRYKGYVCVVRSAKSPILCQTFRFLCENLGEALSIMRELSDKIPDLIENRCFREAIQKGSYACQRDELDEHCPYQLKDCPLDLLGTTKL